MSPEQAMEAYSNICQSKAQVAKQSKLQQIGAFQNIAQASGMAVKHLEGVQQDGAEQIKAKYGK